MKLEELRNAYKSKLKELETLEGEIGDNLPNDEQQKKWESIHAEAQKMAKEIDRQNAMKDLKDFGDESQGSKVAMSFGRETLPGEGDIPGVTADAYTGEMYPVDGAYKTVGAKKLSILKSGEYKDAFADYIRMEGLKRPMKGDAMKILNEGTDTSGGFWLPPDFRPELVKRMATMASVRPNATAYTTGTDHITFPSVQYTGASADDALATLYTSGVRFSWRTSAGSTTDITEATNPVAGQIVIPVHLATAAIIVTREQLEDNSFDILGYINQLGGEAFGLGEESAFTTGTGSGQPRGYVNHPSHSIAASTTGTSGGVTYTGTYIPSGSTVGSMLTWVSTAGSQYGITGTEADLPPQYESGARWYATKKTYAAIRQINAGTTTLPQWALGDSYPSYANNMQASLLCYPITKNQFMDATGTANNYPLVLGDMKGYYIVDRVGLSVEVFREVYGLRDQVVIYMRKRVGGDLVHYWKLRFLKNAAS